MTEKKKRQALNYERLWDTAKEHIEALRLINSDLRYANIDIEKIEKECSGDPEKCWHEYWEQLRSILNEDAQ